MTDADQPAEKSLVGIKGWLLLYVIGPGILGTLLTVTDALNLTDSGGSHYFPIEISLAIATVIGLYLIFRVRKPITRTYHIWLNFIWAGYTAYYFVAVGTPEILLLMFAPLLLIWPIYWVRSKRVRATYCQNAA